MANQAVQKYRPVLTGPQISHLISLCKRDGSRDSLSCLSQLVLYEFKIQNEITKPVYASTPKIELVDQLGFSDSAMPAESDIHISPEALYNLWMVKPEDLTVHQINLVQQYRYENNKMTLDEEKKFESEVLGLA